MLVATDAFVYVVKPAGLHTHRLRPDDPPALADRVAVLFPECAGAGLDAREGGAVHRLDRGTSGVVAFARTRAAFVAARDAFAAARVGKHYMAVTTCPFDHVWPPPPDAWIAPVSATAIEVRAPLGPGFGRDRMAVRRTGQTALTRVEPQGPPGPRRLWSLELATGRRHQARVHLAWLGLPILGDELYGGELADRLYLHALRLDLSAAIAGELPVTAPAARVRRGDRLSATKTEADPQRLDHSRRLRFAPTFLRSLYRLAASRRPPTLLLHEHSYALAACALLRACSSHFLAASSHLPLACPSALSHSPHSFTAKNDPPTPMRPPLSPLLHRGRGLCSRCTSQPPTHLRSTYALALTLLPCFIVLQLLRTRPPLLLHPVSDIATYALVPRSCCSKE
ncbi:pseudouridine synthase [Nannocystis pusilla]|uniref:pseudouridine synthase n=1 Tax=Nannocystis pusilla TaxID=889268 RepID=UPI003B7A0421